MSGDTREGQGPSEAELFATYAWLADEIAGNIPAMSDVQAALTDAIWPFTNAVVAGVGASGPMERARARIASQATNDFLDLLFEAMSGRGRPAARSARSLFEHAVNNRWVAASLDEAQRYCDQAAIAEELDLELNTATEDQFTGVDRKAFRHWRAKLERRIRPAADTAIAKYGNSFRRQWATANLRDRANGVGLGAEYDSYRLLSMVIHGSAGGDLGQRREIRGAAVVRTGPAVGLL